MGLFGKGDHKGGAVPKGNVEKWLKTVAANDKKYGRNNPKNPNNKRNGK